MLQRGQKCPQWNSSPHYFLEEVISPQDGTAFKVASEAAEFIWYWNRKLIYTKQLIDATTTLKMLIQSSTYNKHIH